MTQPKYDYDTQVRVIRNIRNDSYGPDQRKGQLLIRRGTTGFIRNSGIYQQDQIIYQVHFIETDQIIGCREVELIPANDSWIQNKFEAGDTISLKINLQYRGTIIAKKRSQHKVMRVDRSDQHAILYHFNIMNMDFEVPESALKLVQQTTEVS